jgi:hypothetical protein
MAYARARGTRDTGCREVLSCRGVVLLATHVTNMERQPVTPPLRHQRLSFRQSDLGIDLRCLRTQE